MDKFFNKKYRWLIHFFIILNSPYKFAFFLLGLFWMLNPKFSNHWKNKRVLKVPK